MIQQGLYIDALGSSGEQWHCKPHIGPSIGEKSDLYDLAAAHSQHKAGVD